ncbi:GRIP and coiled-coil domain-containing protein 2 [Biomphalaria glabrata]|nr:GRIP and coiled-coil domain-containing protein 2-like [Biomphalaria glabrata]
MSSTSTHRRRLKIENPEKYNELLVKQRAATKKYQLKKKREWEESTHSQLEIDEYKAKKEKKRQYSRDYYWKSKTRKSNETPNSAGSTPRPAHDKRRPKDMSPNELRKYQSSQRRAQRAALNHQKKTAIRLKNRERMRKSREEAKLARISSSPVASSDRVTCLNQSAYILNNKLKPKNKKYTQASLNLLNRRSPEKKHACQSLFNTKKLENLDIKEELGIQLQDSILEEKEEISKPVHNMVQESDNLDIKEELDIQLQDFLLKEPHQEEDFSKPAQNLSQESDNLDIKENLGIQLQDSILKEPEQEEEMSKPVHNIIQRSSEMELCVMRLQLEEIHKEKQILEHKMVEAEAKWKSSEEDYKLQITKLEVCMKDLQEQLTSARKSMKQNSMLDLEMADYERTLSTLHNQVEERDKKIEELKAKLDKLDQRITLKETKISWKNFRKTKQFSKRTNGENLKSRRSENISVTET